MHVWILPPMHGNLLCTVSGEKSVAWVAGDGDATGSLLNGRGGPTGKRQEKTCSERGTLWDAPGGAGGSLGRVSLTALSVVRA